MIARAACLVGVLALVGACAASDDGASGSVQPAGVVTAPTPTDEMTESTTRATVADEIIESTLPTVPEDPGIAEELGLQPIELLTDPAGGGTRPLLEWSEVVGAVHYHVVVLAPNGSSYWAWRTTETSVPVGGTPRLEPEAVGPSISPGMSWSVLAVSGDGTPVALSGRRPIAP
jgi:hypothetical protein